MSLTRRRFAFPACVIAGILCAFSLTPFGIWPLMFVGLAIFYVACASATGAGRAAFCGFFFGMGYFVTGLWWIGNALLVDGNEFWWVWPLAVLGLPTLLSAFTAVAAGAAKSTADLKTLPGFIFLAVFIALSEWVRGHIFTGFPWNLFGYVWTGSLPMAQTASIVGSYGLTLITIMGGMAAGFIFIWPKAKKQKIIFAAVMAGIFAGMFIFGAMRLSVSPTMYQDNVTLNIIQPNIEQDMKWDETRAVAHFEKHLALSHPPQTQIQNTTNLIIWPETAISSVFLHHPVARRNIRNVLNEYAGKAFLISGILDRRETGDDILYYNGVAVFDQAGNMTPVYNKTHLVPFGEYIPFQDYIPLKPVAQFSGFEKGPGPTTVSHDGIPAFSPLVCYEIIFPGKTTSSRPARPQWIVNVTNDAWYGDSAGPHQHFAHIIFRAIEEGVPVIRSANTGISGAVDPVGRVLVRSDIYTDAALKLPLPRALSETTPYSNTENWNFLVLCLVCIGVAIGCRRYI